ncbi:hypothetical protein DFH27DRAFT_65574 [Peziza echinospora]|nr:hypothetical protein DFH27DRAFT_65574 [Peziza echinospora]
MSLSRARYPSSHLRLTAFRSLASLVLRLCLSTPLMFSKQAHAVTSVPFLPSLGNGVILARARGGGGQQPQIECASSRVGGGGMGHSMLDGWSVSVVAVGMFVMVVVSGVLSGLTLGLMSIDMTRLHVLAVSGTPKQRQMVNTILPVKKYPYFLLCSLLIASVLVNEMLPIMNARLFGESYKALFISAALVIVFGEIIPQAVFPRYALELGSSMIWLVYLCMFVCGLPAAVLSSILYYTLRGSGTTHSMFTSSELVTFIELHSEDNLHGNEGGALESRTVALIKGVVEAQELVVGDVVRGMEHVYMVNAYLEATRDQLRRLLDTGYSRIPVYEMSKEVYEDSGLPRLTFLGCLHTRNFFELDREPVRKVRNIGIIPLPIIDKDRPLYDILAIFKAGKAKMALVADPTKDHHPIDTNSHDDFFQHSQHTNPRIQLEVGMGPSTVSYLQNDILWTNHPLSAQKEIVGIVTMDDVMKALLGRSSYPRRRERVVMEEKLRVDEEWKYAVDAATATTVTTTSTLRSDGSSLSSSSSFLPPIGRFESRFSLEKAMSSATSRTAFSVGGIGGCGGGGGGGGSGSSTNSTLSSGTGMGTIGGHETSALISSTSTATLGGTPEIDAGVGTGIGTGSGIGSGMANVGVHHTGTLRRRFSFEGALDEKEANLLEGGD